MYTTMARLQIIVTALLTLLLFIALLYRGQPLPATLTQWVSSFSKLQSPLNPLIGDYGPMPACMDDEYLLGVGKADITGPVVEINMMGYADPKQLGSGLRQRLYARAFIVGSPTKPKDRIVYTVLDTQSGDTAIRYGILQGLAELGPRYAVYGPHNVAVTGTHSHSGPGAWLNYLLPQITSKGFNKQSFQAIVSGTVLAIRKAHESLEPGRLSFASTEIKDANINRSLWAYLANPKEELDRYEHSVDKTLTMLRFQRSGDGKDIGVLTWFPVHGTSMLGNNTIITGDNKGVAAHLFEKEAANSGLDLVSKDFVAGFSQSNVGDTSPNVLGAYCEDGSGQECDFETSLCNNISQTCHGRGPFFGLDDGGTKSCFEIGRRQFSGVKSLFDEMRSVASASTPIKGPIRSLHSFRNMSNYTFTHPNGSTVRTCSAALGYSFAAGTTDGPGAFDFKQNNSGDPNANPLWASVSRFIHAPTDDQIACQAPKPILLDVGATTSPYQWTPNIVDIQLFRVGQLFIVVAPGEATTMAGRRWKSAIASAAASTLSLPSSVKPLVVLGGPANTYAHYIATEEEYGIQRYEGASTLYGPHTLNAYINLTTSLLPYLSASTSAHLPRLDPGPAPPIHINSSLSFITPVVFDAAGFFRSFGAVLSDVLPATKHTYIRGSDNVVARFVGANPRNNLRLEETYAAVEKLREGTAATFDVVADDADWDLVYRWRRTSEVAGTSEVEITWEIPADAAPGKHRLVYYGDRKVFGSGRIEAFVGRSGVFAVG